MKRKCDLHIMLPKEHIQYARLIQAVHGVTISTFIQSLIDSHMDQNTDLYVMFSDLLDEIKNEEV